MALPALSRQAFQVLLSSASMGTHLDLSSSQFRVSVEQLEALLLKAESTAVGRVTVRGTDFDSVLISYLLLRYGPRFYAV